MRLLTIGDSISQGFMSGAGARSELAYSTLIARAMGLAAFGRDYPLARWPEGGMPFDFERLIRRAERMTGPEIALLEWPQLLTLINSQMDRVEDCYERGEGAPDRRYGSGEEWFANLSIWGQTVADAWQLTPDICRAMIREADTASGWLRDGLFQLPSASFHRSALTVLSPQRDPRHGGWSALDWLKYHHESTGLDDVIIWLGANNALGTITRFTVKATNGDDRSYDPGHDHVRRYRDDWNLWSPEHFAIDYRRLIQRVDAILSGPGKSRDPKVYLGTVPPVTVAPLAKGVGEASFRPDPFGALHNPDGSARPAKYFKYYTYVAFGIEDVDRVPKLPLEHVYAIDCYVAAYRDAIRAAAAAATPGRFHVVDMADVLLRAAYRRNDGMPTYDFPAYVHTRFPVVDTRYYHATAEGRVEQGGIFSLDGVHPSAIGQGLVADAFLRVIDRVRTTDLAARLDWEAIYTSDDLYARPLRLMPQLRQLAQGSLGTFLMGLLRRA